MRKFTAFYLMTLGASEIVLYFLREAASIPVFPQIGLLWLLGISDSSAFLLVFVFATAFLLTGTGISLVRNRRPVVLLYCMMGGAFAVLDLLLPVVVLVRGGGHVMSAGDAGLMILVSLFYDALPVSLCICLLLRRKDEARQMEQCQP